MSGWLLIDKMYFKRKLSTTFVSWWPYRTYYFPAISVGPSPLILKVDSPYRSFFLFFPAIRHHVPVLTSHRKLLGRSECGIRLGVDLIRWLTALVSRCQTGRLEPFFTCLKMPFTSYIMSQEAKQIYLGDDFVRKHLSYFI